MSLDAYRSWVVDGRPVSDVGVPHAVRAGQLRALAMRWGLTTFVETGTATGAMIEALHDYFTRLISIEIHETYFAAAQANVGSSSKVTLHHGDSAELFPEIIEALGGSALVFLDGHWSGPNTGRGRDGDTPIRAELDAVFTSRHRHVTVIDDARHFGMYDDYPSLVWLLWRGESEGYEATVEGDAVIFQPLMDSPNSSR